MENWGRLYILDRTIQTFFACFNKTPWRPYMYVYLRSKQV